MKKVILTLAFILFFATLSVHSQVNNNTDNDWGYLSRYAKANKELQIKKSRPNVVFLGNSITEFWARMDSSFFQNNNFVGRGISGQTTSQFLIRFREDVINLNPKILVLNGGTNDIAENEGPYNEDYTFNNIITMVELAKYHNIKVLMTSVIPAAGFNWNLKITDAPEKIKSLNARLKTYAQSNGITYVDYYSKLIGPNGRDIIPSYSSDGVHPVIEGYKVMEGIILPVIQNNLLK